MDQVNQTARVPPNRLEALHSLYGSTSQHQFPLAGYLNQNHDSNHHQPQQLNLQLLQSLMQQQPTRNQFNGSLLQPFGQQTRTQPAWHLDSLRPIANGLTPSSLAGLNSDLQSHLLRSLANPSSSQNTGLVLALEKQSILDRARALNEIEIRRALERDCEQQGHQHHQQQHQAPGQNKNRLNFHDSMGQQSIQTDSVARKTLLPSADEANLKLNDSQTDHASQACPVCAPLPFTVGGEGVTDLRMVQDSNWESRFRDLVQYKREHGHCNVPRRYKGNPKLGVWVCSIRQQMARGTLNKAKMERLNQIGFQWRMTVIKGGQINPQIAKVDQWIDNFQLLASINERTGNCTVPASSRMLCKWVDRQRREMDNGKLSIEKQEKLNSIGFQWKPVAVAVT